MIHLIYSDKYKFLKSKLNHKIMFRVILFISLILLMTSCQNEISTSNISEKKVSNAVELNDAIANASAGDNIILTNGVWKDIQINFTGKGTKTNPILLRAEKPGEVFLEGKSCLKLCRWFIFSKWIYSN